MFGKDKKTTLEKKDNSKKGCVDEEIKSLLDLINSNENFYTTSSCAGRIVLLKEPKSGKKKDAEWLYVSHKEAKSVDIRKALKSPPEETVWLRQEPFIIHVCAKTVRDADRLMDLLRAVGLKHSGILTTRKRIMIEIIGLEHMDVPIAKNNEILTDKEYLKFIVEQANQKLRKNQDRIKRFQDALSDKASD